MKVGLKKVIDVERCKVYLELIASCHCWHQQASKALLSMGWLMHKLPHLSRAASISHFAPPRRVATFMTLPSKLASCPLALINALN